MQREVSLACPVSSPGTGTQWFPGSTVVSITLALIAVALPVGISTANAQEGTIAGRVVADGSQRPIPNV